MAFCRKCGCELPSDSCFCPSCGTPVINLKNHDSSNSVPPPPFGQRPVSVEKPSFLNRPLDSPLPQTIQFQKNKSREEIWEGKIHKCPYCGEILGSFAVRCPSCGKEFRDLRASNSIENLSRKLQEIEFQRSSSGRRKWRILKNFDSEMDEFDQRKITLIKTYPIPNSAEDIKEFVILASSNIDDDSYNFASMNPIGIQSRRAVSDAWIAKCEQAIKKAQFSFGNDPVVDELKAIVDEAKNRILASKRKGVMFYVVFFAGMLLFFFILIGVFLLIKFVS